MPNDPPRRRKNRQTKKSPKKRWAKRVIILIPVIAALIAIFSPNGIIGIIKDIGMFLPHNIRYAGVIKDQNGNLVGNALIEVYSSDEEKQPLGRAMSDSLGEFDFVVKNKEKESVWVKASKDGHVGFEGRQILTVDRIIPFRCAP